MLAYDYRAGSARLDDLPQIPISPHLYVLCDRCATSLRAPRGWILDDRRSPPAPVLRSAPSVEESVDATEATAEVEPAEPAATIPAAAASPALEDGQRQLAFGYS